MKASHRRNLRWAQPAPRGADAVDEALGVGCETGQRNWKRDDSYDLSQSPPDVAPEVARSPGSPGRHAHLAAVAVDTHRRTTLPVDPRARWRR